MFHVVSILFAPRCIGVRACVRVEDINPTLEQVGRVQSTHSTSTASHSPTPFNTFRLVTGPAGLTLPVLTRLDPHKAFAVASNPLQRAGSPWPGTGAPVWPTTCVWDPCFLFFRQHILLFRNIPPHNQSSKSELHVYPLRAVLNLCIEDVPPFDGWAGR